MVCESSFGACAGEGIQWSRDFDVGLIYPDGAMNDGTRHKFELQREPQN